MADKLEQGTGSTTKLEKGTGGQQPSAGSTPSSPSNTSSGYSKSGGGGGGGSSKSAKDEQAETQAQINNLADINLYRKGDLDKITKGREEDINKIAQERLNDMNKIAQQELGNINSQRSQNDASLQTRRGQIERNVQWQPQQQKEQSMLMQLRNRMGNAAYGSNLQDLLEGMQRIDDMGDVALIQAWKENQDAAFSDWSQADASLVSDYNKLVSQILDEYSQFESDYNDQISKQQRDYQDKVSQLYTNYWTNVSNINAQLASKKNMNGAAAKEAQKVYQAILDYAGIGELSNSMGGSTSGNAKLSGLAKSAANAVSKTVNNVLGNKSVKTISTKGLTGAKKTAAEIVNKTIKNASKTTDIKAALQKAANDYVKNNSKATVGEDTDKYTLPDIKAQLTKLGKMPEKISITPSAALSKMLVQQQNKSTINDKTKDLVRTPASRTNTAPGGNNGAMNYSRSANQGFNDNLAAFRR